MALNGTWDVNYGLHAQQNGPNIPLTTSASPQSVTFYYDHKTHWVTENVSSIIATVPGSFQSELGCSGDWDPACFRTWLEDVQGSGIYSFSTSAIPAGSYECKVALNGNWDVNYGAGGAQNGPNIAFTVPANGMEVEFEWNSSTKVLRVIVGGIQGDLSKAQAYWLTADTIAWNVPTDAAVSLFADPDGALTIDGPGIVAGANSQSWVLTHDPAGLSPALREKYPHLANLPALSPAARRSGGRGRTASKASSPLARCEVCQGVDATGLQIAGVLDDLYAAKAGAVTLGPSLRNGLATLRVWAPTARAMKVRVFADSAPGTMYGAYAMTLDPASGVWSYSGGGLNGKYYLYEAQVYVRTTNKVETNVVTDPYSISLARNSTRSQVVSLDDPELQPRGWRNLHKPFLAAPEDIVLYELHVRDFSATDADRAREPARHLRGVHAEALGRHEAPRPARTRRRHARASAAGLRLRHHQRRQVAVAGAVVRRARGTAGRFLRAAGAGRGYRGSRRVQLGLRSAALQRARGQLRHRSRRLRAHSRVPRDGAVAEPDRAARGHGRGLQPHQFRRPESRTPSSTSWCPATTTA